MQIRQTLLFPALLAVAATSCADLDQPDQLAVGVDTAAVRGDMAQAVAERRRLAASGRLLKPRVAGDFGTAALADDMAVALDIPPAMITSATLTSGDARAAAVRTSYGVIQPQRGDSFVLLSTGVLDEDAEPGADFGAVGPDGDAVTLRVTLNVPARTKRMTFRYRFLSAEYPDFIQAGFNDTFTLRVASNPIPVASATVDDADFHDAAQTNVGGTPYFLLIADPDGVDGPFPAGDPSAMSSDTGTTDFLLADIAIPTGPVTLEFDIRDSGDGILDSAVIIDDLRFSSIETVDPNNNIAIDSFDGTVRNDPVALTSSLRPVDAVAADGTTQILLRTTVSSPGNVTFSLPADHLGDGALSAVGSGVWGDQATVATQPHGGQHHVFALYRSPNDFNRGGDEAARSRELTIGMEYVPPPGSGASGFTTSQTITIVRPPVVVMHGLWLDCPKWLDRNQVFNNKATGGPFTVTCETYASSKGFLTSSNNRAVSESINSEAIAEMRALGVAVTQVDVIGHDMGGLLTRRYVDSQAYFRHDNFYEGDIHRFISLNTPHLGARMAREIVITREDAQATGAWTNLKKTLEGDVQLKVFIDDEETIDDVAIDQLSPGSNVITALGETPVPSHAIVSTGGVGFLQQQGNAIMGGGLRALYPQMERLHPIVKDNTDANEQKSLIFRFRPQGSTTVLPSKIFCDDDHDMFATTYEQTGGLVATPGVNPISSFAVALAQRSEHFQTFTVAAQAARMAELLNGPMDELFAASIPAPSDVPPVTTCVPPEPPEGSALQRTRALAAGTLAIVSPTSGTLVAPGSTITVTLEATGFLPQEVLLIGGAETLVLDTAPFVAQVQVPADAIGRMSLFAVGFGEEDLAYAEEVELIVGVEATLQSVEVFGGNVSLGNPGITRQLLVRGHYSDGVVRDITSADLGTRYATTDGSVATVSADGLVTATGQGVTTLVARNGAVVTSVNVRVIDSGVAPVAVCTSVTVSANASCQAQASIDGGSHDPDQLPQPLQVVQSPAGPFAVGVHPVSLEVSDGQQTDTCTATVTVVDDAAPVLACDDVVVEATPGLGGAYVSYAVTATDNCEGSLPVICSVPSGTFVGMGESVAVTCVSMDTGGHSGTCEFALQVDEPAQCEASTPEDQDYWRTQCNYRAPDGTPPDAAMTAEIFDRLLAEVEADLQAVCDLGENTCEGLNPDPYYDECEVACQEYAAWLLNLASARSPSQCCNLDGSNATAAAHVAALIALGQCEEAAPLARDLNRNCVYCGTQP